MKIQKNNTITLYPCQNRRGQADKPDGFHTPCPITEGDTEQAAKAVTWDNCIAKFKNGYRKKENYLQADCILADIDNTHSDRETDWITHEDVIRELPDVAFYYYPSRNHMKQKDGKSPRPKEHYLFPTHVLKSSEEYTDIVKALVTMFPQLHFDIAVTGAAQLNFGVEHPIVSYVDGSKNITDYISSIRQKKTEQTPATKSEDTSVIPQGKRNTTLHQYALRVLTRYGVSESTYHSYYKEAQKCSPLLEQKELQAIWDGAVNYYNSTIKTEADYISPSIYNAVPSTAQWVLPQADPVAVRQLYNIDRRDRKFSIATAKLILKAVGVTIRYNDMNQRIEVDGIPPKYGEQDLNNLLGTFISDIAYGMSFRRITTNVVQETLTAIASENHYHPVLSLLQEQPWDNTDRLQKIYRILDLTEPYYQVFFRKWALQTIAVLFNSNETPVTTEGILVLQGKQGIGKTQFFRHLAINECFFKGGATLDMSNKDSLMSATKVWICELGEIDSTTKKEQSALKAFLTEKTDHFREPYARHETIRFRKTSFCGTVNPQCYLRDETGNRRYWTIPIEHINLQEVFALSPEWYTQFWRQMLTLYQSNPNGYLLTMEEQEFVNQNNHKYEQPTFGEDEFMTYFDFQSDKLNWIWQSASNIANLLNEQYHSLHISSVQIGKLLCKIETSNNIVFERKTIRGRRLILCPPSFQADKNRNTADIELPDYKSPVQQYMTEDEDVTF